MVDVDVLDKRYAYKHRPTDVDLKQIPEPRRNLNV